MSQQRSEEQKEPRASRPAMQGYGVPESAEGMLPWRFARERLERARNYWVCTVRPDGRPHAVPVWTVWVGNVLYFGTAPTSQKARNLATNPAVVVHLESGDEVVIVEGTAEPAGSLPAELFEQIGDAYAAKYEGYRPESPAGQYVVRPRLVYGWHRFPTDVTRWHFDSR
jgi:PPOX class probable F420-dependent enzyme